MRRNRSRPVRRTLTPIQKAREKALIEADLTKQDIAMECRKRFGSDTSRGQVFDVFRDRSRSIDRIERVTLDMLADRGVYMSRDAMGWPTPHAANGPYNATTPTA